MLLAGCKMPKAIYELRKSEEELMDQATYSILYGPHWIIRFFKNPLERGSQPLFWHVHGCNGRRLVTFRTIHKHLRNDEGRGTYDCRYCMQHAPKGFNPPSKYERSVLHVLETLYPTIPIILDCVLPIKSESPVDFYLPNVRSAIHMDGEQHHGQPFGYDPSKYKRKRAQPLIDSDFNQAYSALKGINVIRIPYYLVKVWGDRCLHANMLVSVLGLHIV